MRHPKARQGLVALALLILMVIVFMAARSGSVLVTQRFGRPALPDANTERKTPEPLVPIGAQFEPIVTLPYASGAIDSLQDIPAMPVGTTATLDWPEEPELPRRPQSSEGGQDAVAQTWAGTGDMPSPIANFDGISLADQVANFSPPDTEGDIGYDPATGKRYYLQWINLAYKAWDVTNPAAPLVIVPLTAGNHLWQVALPGTPCASTNNGDPIVLFDEQAHRWFISQFSLGPAFSGPFHQCVAVSKTANPAGGWYVYDYPYRDGATYLNDYPHFGVWPDATYSAYFMTIHEFDAAGAAYLGQSASAFDRAKLLNGDGTAPLVTFALGTNYGGMLAADLDGPPPDSGTPGFFFMTAPAGTLQIWEFKPDWATPGSSSFGVGVGHTSNYTLTVATYTDACDTSTCALVPQTGTSRLLDTLGDRLMHRVAFRALGGITQTAVLNHTVDVDGTGGSTRTGVRWYEVRRNPASGVWSVNQQSTYAPGSNEYRWMGSIATDRAGNMALGYSVSSSSSFPSIRYVGRQFTDPLSQLPQAEVTVTVSSGAQTGSSRWGDYSMMGVDPQDGCTFWYTQEYNGATSSLPWKTRVASFKFAECTPVPTGALAGTVRNASNNNSILAASVVALDSLGATYGTTTDGSGFYQLRSLPIGTYTVTASASGYNAGIATGVSVAASVTTTQDFALVPTAQADLSLNKIASAATITPNSTLNYTLTVSNSGPNAIATTVTVTDVLPAGYVLSTAAGAGWACSGTAAIVCTRAGLNIAALSIIHITGTAPAAFGLLVNTATVSSSVLDPVAANNTSAVTVTVVPQTDLAITKAGPSFAAPGAALVYVLNVSNHGSLTLGTLTATYTNSAAISIPDKSAQMVTSTIEVAGQPPVHRASASLRGLTHTWPEDIDVLLAAPGGQNTILVSDPRGGNNPASDIDLRFDDAAPPIQCDSGMLVSGIYHPTDCPNDNGNDIFPAPAPAGPYAATLSVFDLVDPNGTWNLFARDDTSLDVGSIDSGWTLTLVSSSSLTVTDTLPAGTTFVAAAGDGWSCAHASGIVTCTRDTLAPGAAPGIAITITAPLTPGPITNVAMVESSLIDAVPADNVSQVTTNVTSVYDFYLPIVLQ